MSYDVIIYLFINLPKWSIFILFYNYKHSLIN